MKFVVDSMLGNLARWLRLLGYDTLYFKRIEDWRLINIAREDSRVLLTKDLSLYRKAVKKDVKSIYIESSDIVEMLATIAKELDIKLVFDESNTRCPLCNTLLIRVTKAEILHLVPQEVVNKYNIFWKCPKCEKVFWQGNHWNTISKILEEVNSKLSMVERNATH
jgi:uncharacterized protein with PIN domain